MKADAIDGIANIRASLLGLNTYTDTLIHENTKMTKQVLLGLIEYFKTLATNCAENVGPEYKAELLELIRETASGKVSSPSSNTLLRLTNRNSTRKNNQNAGGGKGLTLVKYQKHKDPTFFSKALTVSSKTLKKTIKGTAHAVNELGDFLLIDQKEKNYLRKLEKLQNRLVEKGELQRADIIQIKIAEIRELNHLLPAVPHSITCSIIAILTYLTPRLIYAGTRTVQAVTITMPSALVAAGTGEAVSAGASLLGYETEDKAIQYANATAHRVNDVFETVIVESIPEESRWIGWLIGAFLWTTVLGIMTLKYNGYIRRERTQARQQRIKAQEDLNNMLSDEEKKLLTNVTEEEREAIDKDLEEIFDYFGLTEAEKGLDSDKIEKLVKDKYRSRALVEHPNKGGNRSRFERTQQMYDKFKKIVERV